ncbi:hypothetical protein BaRGS_00009706 [Batillaria attramentaria]|uniref:Uncharacterized protein n=1 Tax=Batillaria attramentaria TaxID=370345 RepID=A0ABD0LHZ5_9CAEN
MEHKQTTPMFCKTFCTLTISCSLYLTFRRDLKEFTYCVSLSAYVRAETSGIPSALPAWRAGEKQMQEHTLHRSSPRNNGDARLPHLAVSMETKAFLSPDYAGENWLVNRHFILCRVGRFHWREMTMVKEATSVYH